MTKPLIIIYYHKIPYPYDTGTNQRIKHLVSYLKKYYRVGLIVPFYHENISALASEYTAIWYGAKYINLFDKISWRLTKWFKKRFLEKVLKVKLDNNKNSLSIISISGAWTLYKICKSETPKLIIVEKIFNAIPATNIATHFQIPIILDLHDLYFIGREQGTVFSEINLQAKNISHASVKEEKDLISRFDTVIAIQYKEADMLAKHLSIPVITALHPVQVDRKEIIITEKNAILFVGSASQHNVQAITFFIEEVFYRIKEKYKDISLFICGSFNIQIRTKSETNSFFMMRKTIK